MDKRDTDIRNSEGFIFRGRVIGQMRGKDNAAALGYFVLKLKEMDDRFYELEQTVRSVANNRKRKQWESN